MSELKGLYCDSVPTLPTHLKIMNKCTHAGWTNVKMP